MAKVAPITGLSVTHFHTDEYEVRENGILKEAHLKYRWTNGSNTYSKIEVTYTEWDSVKSKWNQKATAKLSSDATSWDYDILKTKWTPFKESSGKTSANKGITSISASFTAYENIGGKEVKSAPTKIIFKLTPTNKVILPSVDNEQVEEGGVNKWKFIWELDVSHMSDADKIAYNNSIIYQARYQIASVPASKAKNAQTAFNKTNYPSQDLGTSGDPLGGKTTDAVSDDPGNYEWFRVFYDTLAGTSKNYSSIFADSSGPLAPLINDKASKIELTKLILKYTIQANQDHACNIVRIERCFGRPSAATLNYTLKDLSLPVPENWEHVKTINPAKKYANETRTDTIDIGISPGLDEVVWVKIIAKNGSGDNSVIESAPLCLGGFALTSPQIVSLEKSEIGTTVTVSVKNNSRFPNVRVALMESNGAATTSIGVLDGTEQNPWTGTFKYVPPAVDEQGQAKEVKFGVVAFFGKEYKNAVLKSSIVNYQEGETPTSISDVNVEPADGITGAITVSWKTSWSGATGAEVSWSDHIDAWNSNEGPNTAQVTTLESNPSFNIRGLTAGNWYVKVRATKDGGTTYSPYENANQWPFKYSSTPDTTQVSLDPENISVGAANTIVASWGYKNSDNSVQKSAVLYEVFSDKSVVTGYYYQGRIYTTQAHVTEIPGEENTIYIAVTDTSVEESWDADATETKSHTLNNSPKSGTTTVTIDGVSVSEGFSIEKNVITFETAPTSGSHIVVNYVYSNENAQYEWDSENDVFYYLRMPYIIKNAYAYRDIGHVEGEKTSLELAPWINDNWRNDPGSVFKGWVEGSTHLIVVETTSNTDLSSSFDYGLDNSIAGTLTINSSAFIPDNFISSNIDIFACGFNQGKLVDMPMFIKLADFQKADNIVENTDNVKLVISRVSDLISPNRPDDSTNDGFENETIFSTYISGSELESYKENEGTEQEIEHTGGILIENSDLVGHLDDGCSYRISLVITRNKLKARPKNDPSFIVEWTNQAADPIIEQNVQAIDPFTGDEIKTEFILSYIPVENSTVVTINGTEVSDYSIDGNKIIFDEPPANEAAIVVTYFRTEIFDIFETVEGPDGETRVVITPHSGHKDPTKSVFDIYRLTKDKPKLIVESGIYGQSFIDPYPSIGCKYRIVDRTPNGDWIAGIVPQDGGGATDTFSGDGTESEFPLSHIPVESSMVVTVNDTEVNNYTINETKLIFNEPPGNGSVIIATYLRGDIFFHPAWIDLDPKDEGIDISYHGLIINFEDSIGEVRINAPLDVTLSNSWTKDFQSTKYLNGHIVGDWNSGVERKLSANSKYVKDISKVIDQDKENILDAKFVDKIRRLANHAGICHVRTIDGSSITADIQVSEDNNSNEETLSYSFDISEVESEELDGILYEEE